MKIAAITRVQIKGATSWHMSVENGTDKLEMITISEQAFSDIKKKFDHKVTSEATKEIEGGGSMHKIWFNTFTR